MARLNKEYTMLSDPTLFFQQIIQQTLSHFSQGGTGEHAAPNSNISEAALAEILGGRLAEMFKPEGMEASSQGADPDGGLSQEERVHYQELIERNNTLAFALGACVCWGELWDCHVCAGQGKPGWTLPDPRYFTRLIRPALRTIKDASAERNQNEYSKHRVPENER